MARKVWVWSKDEKIKELGILLKNELNEYKIYPMVEKDRF